MCSTRARGRACAARCGRCAASSASGSWSTASACRSARRGGRVGRRARVRAARRRATPRAGARAVPGRLLDGVEDEWALAARERHRERVIELLEELARAAEERGDAREAIELTRRQVERDPFDEEAHRRLITRLAAAGDRAGALRAYRALAERLRRELGVAPSAQTRELVEQLRAARSTGSPRSSAALASRAAVGLLPLRRPRRRARRARARHGAAAARGLGRGRGDPRRGGDRQDAARDRAAAARAARPAG